SASPPSPASNAVRAYATVGVSSPDNARTSTVAPSPVTGFHSTAFIANPASPGSGINFVNNAPRASIPVPAGNGPAQLHADAATSANTRSRITSALNAP